MNFGFWVGCFRSFQFDPDRCLERLAGLQKRHGRLHDGNRFVVTGARRWDEHITVGLYHLRFFVADQFRHNQQVGTGDLVVQPVNSENVTALN